MSHRRSGTGSRPATERKPRRKHWARWVSGSFAAVAAVVGLLAATTSLVDWLERRLSPPSDPPPALIDARILGVDLRRAGEPLAAYLRSTQQSVEGLTRPERREPGLVFAVRVRLQGATGKAFPLKWTLYDMRASAALAGLYRQEAVTFKPEGPNHARTWPIWVPYPTDPGRYRLDLVLADAAGQPVDERSSRPFTLDSIPRIASA